MAAWITTAGSVYALLWLAGDAHGLRLGRVRVAGDALIVEIGLRWRAIVPRSAIASAVPIEGKLAKAPDLLRAELLWPTVLVTLREPVRARGPFGIEKRVTRITLGVDERERFLTALERW